MKIDAHQHFWHYDPVEYGWINDSMAAIKKDFLPEDLEPVLKANEFEGTVLVQAHQSEVETAFLLKLAEESSFVKAVVGWVDLSSDNVEERLEFFSRNSYFKGIRHTVWDERGEFMTDENFQKGLLKLADFDLSYDLLVFDYQLPGAIEMTSKFPEQRFVLDHMGKPQILPEGPSEEWAQNIRKLAENKNVSCKLSGLVTETENFNWKKDDFTPFLGVAVEAFGIDRIMFGSDWPVCLSVASYEEVLEIQQNYFRGFSEEEKQKIFGKNAAEFYRI